MFCYRRIMITWRLCFYCFWVWILQSPRGPSFITALCMKNAPISNIWKWFANGLLVPCNLGVCINYCIHRTELQRAWGLWVWASGSNQSMQYLKRKPVLFCLFSWSWCVFSFCHIYISVQIQVWIQIYIYIKYIDTSHKKKNWKSVLSACLERAICKIQNREIYLKTYGNRRGEAWRGHLPQHGMLHLNLTRSCWTRLGDPMLGLAACRSSLTREICLSGHCCHEIYFPVHKAQTCQNVEEFYLMQAMCKSNE